ncbi:hypothetical protein BDW75DRAFT_226465 [Aspergillus navahoensis]
MKAYIHSHPSRPHSLACDVAVGPLHLCPCRPPFGIVSAHECPLPQCWLPFQAAT